MWFRGYVPDRRSKPQKGGGRAPPRLISLYAESLVVTLLQVGQRGQDFLAVGDGLHADEHLGDVPLRIDDEGVAGRELHAVVLHHRAVLGGDLGVRVGEQLEV